VPVIILSAEASPNHIQRVLAAGAHSYLTKPLDIRALLRTIDELVMDGA
jgi:DNA-binding response OmpR family regulator